MKKVLVPILACVCLASCTNVKTKTNPTAATPDNRPVLNVTDFGAVPDGQTDCTAAFNQAIDSCSAVKGIVVVPQGKYLCSTIELKSNVELRLEKDAEILANLDPDTYTSFVPKRDMSCYDSGNGTLNQNNSKDLRWNRSLILANDVENIAITGEGSINGRHVFDALGEERMRGPHTLVFGDCRNVNMSGITINCAANYAFMGYALENATFSDVKINEGWDGIHIRGGKNVTITGCHFQTGDDSIAGGYWENMTITGCNINSSCNGIRMIMPSENLLITECDFHGPGAYPHRTSGEKHRTNMLFGIVFEPGGWGAAPGDLRDIIVSDCTMSKVQSPIAVSISKDNTAHNLSVSNVSASGVYGTFAPIVTYNDKGFEKMTVSNITMTR